IETAERLVEDQEVGLVQGRGDELRLLQHAFRKLLAALALDAFEADALEAAADPLREPGAAHALQPRDVGDELADPHLAVHAALFRQVADPVLRVERGGAPEHGHAARIREEDRHDHPDRRRLTRAVRADEAAEGAAGHDEVEVVDGLLRAEAFRDALEHDGGVGERGVRGDHASFLFEARPARVRRAVDLQQTYVSSRRYATSALRRERDGASRRSAGTTPAASFIIGVR